MTISTTTSRASYNGNGVTTLFSVPFRFFQNADLVVQLVTVSTGASTTLTLTTHYTVTGADDESGGSVTMLTAPAVGQRLVIRRVIGATQEVDYVAGDPFPAETHERALDRLTMLAQQGEEVNARALVFPSGDTASGELPAVATRASKLLGFNSSGELTVSAPASGSAADLALDLAGVNGAASLGKAGGGTVQDHIDSAAAGDASYKTRLLAGVIRQDTASGGWYFLDDTGHKPNGLTGVTVNGTGEIVVTYGFTAADVGALIVGPDEVYANLGIWAGASVGDATATIHLFQNLYGTVNLGTRSVASNTYFTGTLSAVLNADGTVTVTHPSCGSASVGCYGGDTQGFDVRVQSYTATTVTFASWVDFSGYIEYNGSAWTVTTQAFNKPTMAFSSGTLTVTHETLATQDANVTVDGRDLAGGTNNVHIRPGQSTTTTFDAIFRDNSGAMVTTPNTSMRFYYSSVARVKREVPIGTINFLRPNCKLDANNVASGSGNFWIVGAMKV